MSGYRNIFCLFAGACLWVSASSAQAAESFSAWLTDFKAEAVSKGIAQKTIDATLKNVTTIDRVLELDRQQPEFTMTFDTYLSRVVSDQRIRKGRELLAANRVLLDQVSAKYGVPPQVIVAMWGIESDFGRLTGNFSVVDALATLAFDGRRSKYFRGELFNVLKMVDSGRAHISDLKGSWAGAMGQCQFMPSTYISYAQDWRGDGHADIWNDQEDVFASAANYLSKAGWKADQKWGRAVTLPPHGAAPALFGPDQKRTVTEWSKLGFKDENGNPLPYSDLVATLIRAESGKAGDKGVGRPYLVYDNFQVFMKWNRSTFFALAAGTLADAIASN